MAVFFAQSVVSPVLIGREEYLASFERAFDQLSHAPAQMQALLVSGEAGIGKTRLLAEVKARLRPEQACWLQGASIEQDRLLPLAPLLDVLRTLLLSRDRDDYLGQLAPFAPELIKILPDLALWLPHVAPTPVLEPEQEKRRLFVALSGFLLGLAEQRPVVLALEDLHWSDETSLEFLLFLLRHRGTHALLVLLTYRGNEGLPSLHHFLTSLNRERTAVEFSLTALSEEEVHELVRTIFQMKRPVHQDFLKALYSLTEGNPFFLEEVLKALLARGDIFFSNGIWDRKPLSLLRIPGSIADAVQLRLGMLNNPARELLAVAAAIGRHVDFVLLQAVIQRPADELLSLLELALAAQLLIETRDGQVAFRHALTQQTIYERLPTIRRKATHLSIGQALERLSPSNPGAYLADLAYHFYRAEVWPQALEYWQRMGERALALYAPQAAIHSFNHALEAAAHLPGVTVFHMYHMRGQAHDCLGNFDAARNDFEQALEAAHVAENRDEEWQILMKLGWLLATHEYPRVQAYIQRALDLARQLDDPLKYAHNQTLFAHGLTHRGQPMLATPLLEQALAVFQERGHAADTSIALEYLALNLSYTGDFVRAVSCYDQAIPIFRASGEKQRLSLCLALRCRAASGLIFSETVWSAQESLARCQQDLEGALALAVAIEWRGGQVLAHYQTGLIFAGSELLGQGLARARLGLAIAAEMEDSQW